MSKVTCNEASCTAPPWVRGLCRQHYQRHWIAGSLDEVADQPKHVVRHSLSEVDAETRKAVCAVCGPVSIRPRRGKRGAECRGKGGKAATAADRRRWKYGLTRDELAALITKAAGACEVCGADLEEDKEAIDHCHETGVVRGVLCMRCNVGLGWFNDDPARLLAAHLYLLAHGKQLEVTGGSARSR